MLRTWHAGAGSMHPRAPQRGGPASAIGILPPTRVQTTPLPLPTPTPPGWTAEDSWSELASGTFMATCGFAYLVAVLFLLFFLVLLIFQGSVTKELGIYK